MIANILGLSIQTKLIAAAVALLALYGAFKLNNYHHQQIGAKKLHERLIADDNKTIKEKVKRDDIIRSESDDELLNRFDD